MCMGDIDQNLGLMLPCTKANYLDDFNKSMHYLKKTDWACLVYSCTTDLNIDEPNLGWAK